LLAVFLAAMACGGQGDRRDSLVTPATSSESASAAVDSMRRANLAPGPVFDPATVKVGDTLAGLKVSRVDITKAAEDMGYVGNVRFEGEMTVSGERMTHPDYPEVKEVCMTIDSASAHRLPRFPDDQRRMWLCFEDREAAARQLGEAGTRGTLTVVIDRYQTVRHFSDAYDTASLVRVVEHRREP
jgi:hypothetical protein